jgi:TPR repeat protein
LLRGRGCQCESVKGEIWLQRAALADEPNAQVSLAEYLLREHTSSESISGALVWLERATKQNNNAGKYLLASVLASNPDANIRDPARALALADAIERDYKLDSSLWKIRAAAHAARSEYADAKKAQTRATEEAKVLGWDLQPMQQRESLYAARQPGTGNLLNF